MVSFWSDGIVLKLIAVVVDQFGIKTYDWRAFIVLVCVVNLQDGAIMTFSKHAAFHIALFIDIYMCIYFEMTHVQKTVFWKT